MTKKNLQENNNKITVTMTDNRGHPIVLTFEGGTPTNQVVSAVGDLAKILESPTTHSNSNENSSISPNDESGNLEDSTPSGPLEYKDIINLEELPKIERIKLLIRSTYKYGWFSAKDILSLYQEYIGEISHSTVSTYLSRLAMETFLHRRGMKRDLEYMLDTAQLQKIPEYKFIKNERTIVVRRVD